MATITLLEKARQGRLDALASLDNRELRANNVVSIFDYAFDERPKETQTTGSNVVAFRSTRRSLPALAEHQRIAA